MSTGTAAPGDAKVWRQVLVEGHEPLRRAQRIFRSMPSDPRCKLCFNPFAGPGGLLLRATGFRPSPKNPSLCTKCCDRLPAGGIEMDVAVLFADLRGSTSLGERSGARAYADCMQRFYTTATRALLRHGALIDKLIGDEVMALFVPGIAGPSYREHAARAATDLVADVSRDLGLSVGAGVNAGTAFVGNVGAGHMVDLTALGDAVNTAARLCDLADPGEVVLGAELYPPVAGRFPDGRLERLDIRGRTASVDARVLIA